MANQPLLAKTLNDVESQLTTLENRIDGLELRKTPGATQQKKAVKQSSSASKGSVDNEEKPKRRSIPLRAELKIQDWWTLSNRDQRKKAWNLFYKFACPAAFAAFGFYCQSVFLHYATYQYVHRMNKLNATSLSPEQVAHFATLPDPLEHSLGKQQLIQLPILDAVAAAFPAMFFVCSILQASRTLQVWTKVCICAGFLFIVKGLLGAMTTVPDSSGWQVCRDRLKPEGLEWMSKVHTLGEMWWLDFHWVSKYHSPLRYCSDMMYSGHTFVVTLFALGSYESLRIVLDSQGSFFHHELLGSQQGGCVKWCSSSCLMRKCFLKEEEVKAVDEDARIAKTAIIVKSVLLPLLAIIAIGEQGVEIYFVLLSHFHYSMDVAMALLITFLFYTNSAIAIFAKQWELQGFHVFIAMKPNYKPPPGKQGDQEKMTEDELRDWKDKRFRQKEVWVSKGDVFVPFCCFPFCFMSGRAHVYSDDGLLDIMEQSLIDRQYIETLKEKLGNTPVPERPMELNCEVDNDTKPNDPRHPSFKQIEALKKAKEELNFAEGVSWANIRSFTFVDTICKKILDMMNSETSKGMKNFSQKHATMGHRDKLKNLISAPVTQQESEAQGDESK